MDEVKVSVLCCVFNHERYLRKCLESLISQQTNFKYEIVVHDDASTDNSADIIKEFQKKYPNIIKSIFQTENQYSRGNSPSLIVLRHAKGEYIAFCEGDDFWTANDKLQKQIDFLDAHQDYSMCVHAAYYAHEDGTFFSDRYFQPYDHSCEIATEEIIDGWKFATNSIVYRASMRKSLIIPFRGDCPNGDYALSVYMALNGKVFYINELLSAYRLESVGSLNWVWRENTAKHVESRKKYLAMLERINKYTGHEFEDIIKKNIEHVRFEICVASGDIGEAKKYEELYRNLGKKQKLELWLHSYFPEIFITYRKLIGKIKNAKNSI